LRIGVFTPLLSNFPLPEVLARLKAQDIDTVESLDLPDLRLRPRGKLVARIRFHAPDVRLRLRAFDRARRQPAFRRRGSEPRGSILKASRPGRKTGGRLVGMKPWWV